MLKKWKWRIASLSLVTIPSAMWLYIENPIPEFTDTDIVFYIAFIPLFVAIGMELKDYWDSPEPQEEGSPVGNKIAVILGFIVFVLVIFGIVMTVINNA